MREAVSSPVTVVTDDQVACRRQPPTLRKGFPHSETVSHIPHKGSFHSSGDVSLYLLISRIRIYWLSNRINSEDRVDSKRIGNPCSTKRRPSTFAAVPLLSRVTR